MTTDEMRAHLALLGVRLLVWRGSSDVIDGFTPPTPVFILNARLAIGRVYLGTPNMLVYQAGDTPEEGEWWAKQSVMEERDLMELDLNLMHDQQIDQINLELLEWL